MDNVRLAACKTSVCCKISEEAYYIRGPKPYISAPCLVSQVLNDEIITSRCMCEVKIDKKLSSLPDTKVCEYHVENLFRTDLTRYLAELAEGQPQMLPAHSVILDPCFRILQIIL